MKSSLRTTLCIGLCAALASCSVTLKPITQAERQERINADLKEMFDHEEPLPRGLSLYEAMARAVKYNLDIRVKEAEEAFAMTDAKYTQLTMLPSLLASAGYSWRNNPYSILSPDNPGVISTTEDRIQDHYDLQFAWNILDFGVSYYQSKQKADLVMIGQERKRKILQQVIRDTRYAYWRAWAAQRVMRKIKPFTQELNRMLENAEKAAKAKLTNPAESAKYRAELWNTLREMNLLLFDLSKAEPELLAMINAKPGSRVRYTSKIHKLNALPKGLPTDIHKLENIALQDRTELREEDYRKRSNLNEIKKARVELMPGAEITTGYFYDSNSFLVNNNWASFGAKLGLDLLRWPSKYQKYNLAKNKEELAEVRRMALTIAILTQVDIAKLRHNQAMRQYNINFHLRKARHSHYKHLRNQKQSDLTDELELTRAKAAMILADLRYYLAYAESQNAAGQLLDTIGYYPLHKVKSIDVPTKVLAKQIATSLKSTV